MRKLVLITALAALLTACDDDDDDFKFPPLVVSSANVPDSSVHMDVYAQSKGSETEISVYLHRHTNNGFAQFLELNGADSLMGSYDGDTSWSANFEAVRLPSDSDPSLIYYSDSVANTLADDQFDVSFMRDGSALIDAFVTVLPETTFDVSFDSETLTPQSTLQASWTEIEGLDHSLKFVFSCEKTDGNITGFTFKVPNRRLETLVSPFDLDINQFNSPPQGASNCQVVVTLYTKQNQSSLQSGSEEILSVESIRSQEITLMIENEQ